MTRLDPVVVADPGDGISTALDLHSMRLAHGFHFRVLQDPNGDSLFELVDEKDCAYMAFLFLSCTPKALDLLRDIFSTCWYPGSDFPLSREAAITCVPVTQVDSLPCREMWEIASTLGENAFWATPDLLMEVTPLGVGCSTEIMRRGERTFAYVRNVARSSTDDDVIEQALAIRKMLRTPNQIKIQTREDGMIVSWYIPLKKII